MNRLLIRHDLGIGAGVSQQNSRLGPVADRSIIMVHYLICLFCACSIRMKLLLLFCIVDNNRGNKGEQIRRKKENQAIAQLLLIVLSFFLGIIPFCGDVVAIHLVYVEFFLSLP